MTEQAALDALRQCRTQIDEIDRRIVELLNERTTIVKTIGRVKAATGLAIYEPAREEQVFRNVLGHNSGPLEDEAMRRIFERLIDEMRTVQKVGVRA